MEANNVLNEKDQVVVNSTSSTENKQFAELENYLQDEPILDGALVGISIRSASTGDLLYDSLGDTRLKPASNMKLITGFAALSVLGEDHRFTTEILTNGDITENRLDGDLYIKGKGDPTLLPEDFKLLAKKVQESGIQTINGDIIGDDTWYDDVRLSRGLNWSDEHWYYGAQISALTASPNKDYDAGSIIVEVHPSDQAGDKPKVIISPKVDYIEIQNNAKTVSANQEEDVTLNRKHGTNIFTIDGTIPVDSSSVKEWMSVWEPTGYVLDLFKQSLKEQGITWNGTWKTGRVKDGSEVLYSHKSMPLSELFVPFMKLSNNAHAEVMVKEMGKVVHGEGSWEKGMEVIEAELEKAGIDATKLDLRDGSGISHANLLTPNAISSLLYRARQEEWFPVYLHSLPDAGNPERMLGGTLRYRMADLPVQAKTGTIAGVSTLSGYVESKSGETVIFSILVNNLVDEDDGPQVVDQIVKKIYEIF